MEQASNTTPPQASADASKGEGHASQDQVSESSDGVNGLKFDTESEVIVALPTIIQTICDLNTSCK